MMIASLLGDCDCVGVGVPGAACSNTVWLKTLWERR